MDKVLWKDVVDLRGDQDLVQSVRQLDENEKNKSENVNHLEELLRKSNQLNSSKCVRLIDQQIEQISTKKTQSIEKLILSCNKLGKTNSIDWTNLPNDLQVFSHLLFTTQISSFVVFRIIGQFSFFSSRNWQRSKSIRKSWSFIQWNQSNRTNLFNTKMVSFLSSENLLFWKEICLGLIYVYLI